MALGGIANSLVPDQYRQNVHPDLNILNTGGITESFLEDIYLKKFSADNLTHVEPIV